MFKKPIKITNYHKISKKDLKRLKTDLQKHLNPLSSYTPKNLYLKKLEKSKTTIYCDKKDPLFVDTNSKNNYFPTIYALKKFPNLLKCSLKMKFGVETFLKRGAHLMWPGVSDIEELAEFEVDDIVGIKKSDGQFFAVGAIACSKRDVVGEGRVEGVAVYVLHFFGDCLFDLGSREGFEMGQLAEGEKDSGKLEEYFSEKEFPEICENFEEDEGLGQKGDLKGKKIEVKDIVKLQVRNEENKNLNIEEKILNEEKITEKTIETSKTKKSFINKNLGESKNSKIDPLDEKKNLIKKMDKNIIEAFMNCIYLSIKDKDFPIENSTFWNKHIIKCRNPDFEINIKKSSFKKLGKFFQFLNSKKYIVYKEASKKVVTPQILRINKNNYEIKNWNLTVKQIIEEKEVKKIEGNNFKVEIKNKIVNFCQPKSKVKKFLNVGNRDILFEDLKKILKKFLYDKKLLKKDIVTINEEIEKIFVSELKNKSKKKEKLQKKNKIKENEIKYQDFQKILEKNLKFFYIIYDSEKKTEKRINGKFEGIQIIADKLNNRYITKITNLDIFGIDLEKLINIWKIKFGTSGSIQDVLKGKVVFRQVFLQGGFTDVLKEFLVGIGFEQDLVVVVKKCVKPVRRKRK